MCFGSYIAYEMTLLFSLCLYLQSMLEKEAFFYLFFYLFFFISALRGGVNYRKTCRETIGVPVVRATYKKGCVSQIYRQNRSLVLKKDQRFGSYD